MFYTCPRCGEKFELPKNTCPVCENPVPEIAVITTTAWESSKAPLKKWKRIRMILTFALVAFLAAALALPSMDSVETKDVTIPHKTYSQSLAYGEYCVAEIQASSIREFATVITREYDERYPYVSTTKYETLYCYAKLADGSEIMIAVHDDDWENLKSLQKQEGTITIGGTITPTPDVKPGSEGALGFTPSGTTADQLEMEAEMIELLLEEMDKYTILQTGLDIQPEKTEQVITSESHIGTYLSYACFALLAILFVIRMIYSRKINILTQKVDFLLRQIPPKNKEVSS